MSDIMTTDSMEPPISPLAVECEFGIEYTKVFGSTRRVTFKGYATDEVCAALVNAIGMVLTEENGETE